MADMQFGWVVRVVPRERDALSALLANNHKFLSEVRGQFQTAWVEDHFQWQDEPTLECWTTLTYYAAEYPGFIWGPIVLGQAYRNPALLAKMSATLQFLTAGRSVLGIGAGWKEDEHIAYGWELAPPRERLQQLEEAVQIIRAMWSESPASFQGRYYQITDAYCEPRPEPPPPLLLGTAGERVGLKLVARYADWWNGNFITAEEYAHKLEVLDRYCVELQRDTASIKKTYYAFVSLSESPERIRHREGMHVVAGSPDGVTRELTRFRKLGVEHVMINFMDYPETEGVDLFLRKVLPELE